jgi:hypothetical protein
MEFGSLVWKMRGGMMNGTDLFDLLQMNVQKLTVDVASMDDGIFVLDFLDHASYQPLRSLWRIVHSNESVRSERICGFRHSCSRLSISYFLPGSLIQLLVVGILIFPFWIITTWSWTVLILHMGSVALPSSDLPMSRTFLVPGLGWRPCGEADELFGIVPLQFLGRIFYMSLFTVFRLWKARVLFLSLSQILICIPTSGLVTHHFRRQFNWQSFTELYYILKDSIVGVR